MNDLHSCREVATLMHGIDSVNETSVEQDKDGPTVKIEIAADRIPPTVMELLARWGFSLDPFIRTKGDPTETVIRAY